MKNKLNIQNLKNIIHDNNRANYIQNFYIKNNILYMKYKCFNEFIIVDKYYYIYNKLKNAEKTEFDLGRSYFPELFIKNLLIEL